MKKIITMPALLLFLLNSANCEELPNIRELFKNNEAVVYTLNIRNFAAVDKDNDGIIDVNSGDKIGTFLAAKNKLKSLKESGINVIYLLPVTKTGILKALGTAGSLYALNSFDEIDSNLDEKNNNLTVFEEAKEFVNEAHALGLNVVLDLPSCGAYDLSLNKPGWFILDENNQSVIPSDWTDVRLFKVYNEDNSLNEITLENFKKFVDMAQKLGINGIRADVAAIKPPEFWKDVISYARNKDENFFFLAEANPDWQNPVSFGVPYYSSVDDLLKAGFDSYYGSWTDFKNVKTKTEFDKKIEKNQKILKENKNKSVVATLATHDQQAPILRGENYWNMVLWLNVTYPMNSYFLDGFSQADNFTYPYENKKAAFSYTDDEYYYVHSGLFDIFNYSAPIKKNPDPNFEKEFLRAIAFKKENINLIKKGKLNLLKTNNDNVFAYSLSYLSKAKSKELIVIGSLNEKENQKVSVQFHTFLKGKKLTKVKAKKEAELNKNKLEATLEPLEIQVYLLK